MSGAMAWRSVLAQVASSSSCLSVSGGARAVTRTLHTLGGGTSAGQGTASSALASAMLPAGLFGLGAAWVSMSSMTRQQTAPIKMATESQSQEEHKRQVGFRMSPSLFRWQRGPIQMATLSQEELKKQVGYKAVDDYVRSGMVVGLGTGSTAFYAVERVGQKLASGELKDIVAIPTSVRTKEQAEKLGIPLTTLATHSKVDVAIDGADAVDPKLNLVKGGGGAHLREKMVEAAAAKFIVIVDDSKLCDALGPSFPVPVEIVPFCHEHTARVIESLPALAGVQVVLRLGSAANNKPDGDKPAVTDNGNYVLDLKFTKAVKDPLAAAKQLKETIGVVEHGLFIGMASAVIVAGKEGVYVKNAKKGWW